MASLIVTLPKVNMKPRVSPLQKHSPYVTPMKSSWEHFLGLHDLKKTSVWRASVTEMVFVGLFVFGSIIISTGSQMHSTDPTVAIAFFHFLTLVVFIRASCSPSDAHFNPSVTLCTVLSGLYTPAKGLIYIVAQSVGGIFGALCAKTLLPAEDVQKNLLSGCTFRNSTSGLHSSQAFLSEFLFSLILLYTNIMVTLDPKQFHSMGLQLAPSYSGSVAALCIYVSGSIAPGYGGAFMNPARCIGPAAAHGGTELLTSLWIYLCAPALASVVAAALYRGIPPDHRTSKRIASHGDEEEQRGTSSCADFGTQQAVEP